MGGKITVMLFLILLVLVATSGMTIAVDARLSEVNRELEIKLSIQQEEIERLQKSQRVTAQDVDFLEKMIKEEW